MKQHIDTRCVQAGWQPKNGEPRALPIWQSTTWKYSTSDQMAALFDLAESGYFYTRLANPTCDTVAAKITDLEGGAAGMLTSSGQAANFFALFNIASAGDHVVSSSALYGGTSNLFTVTMKKMGIDFTLLSRTPPTPKFPPPSARTPRRSSAKPFPTPRSTSSTSSAGPTSPTPTACR